MKILQTLPEMNVGGVERGTLEIANHLVKSGHEALVVSNGGRLVPALEAAGARHTTLPVHCKSLASLLQVRPFRRLLEQEKPDILHIRSRVPGWIAWLAWRGMNPATRPRLVSTVHGFYSVNRYSAVMTSGQRVIVVSESVRDYVLKNYSHVNPEHIRVIHRGVSPGDFPRGHQPTAEWLSDWHAAHPALRGCQVLLLPGRISRWKGHRDFLQVIATLRQAGQPVHGLILGDTHPRKPQFKHELAELAKTLGITPHLTFLGHRSDVRDVMSVADVVFSLSLDPEAFGRVSLEAMALGKPVIAYDHGGVSEQMRVLFPQGLVPPGDPTRIPDLCRAWRETAPVPKPIVPPFRLEDMCRATTEIYQELLQCP